VASGMRRPEVPVMDGRGSLPEVGGMLGTVGS
jgi:hypothetical protein